MQIEKAEGRAKFVLGSALDLLSTHHHRRKELALCLVIMVAFATGCTFTRNPDAFIIRNGASGISAGERVAIIASEYRHCNPAECVSLPITKTYQEYFFEKCLSEAIQSANASFAIIPKDEITKLDFTRLNRDGATHTIEELLGLMKEPEFRRQAQALKLRYLVVLKVDTREGRGEGRDYGTFQGFMFVREHERSTNIAAEVLDVQGERRSGSVTANSYGKAGWGFGIAYILPFPVFYSAATELNACRSSLGEAVARFIMSND